MAYWLIKSEPDCYSWDQLKSDGRTHWDGVRNAAALQFMAQTKKGDQCFYYHTGNEKAIIGIAEVVRGSYPEPGEDNPRFVLFDVKPKKALKRPVTLKKIKADRRFADFALVRISRLGVMPVPEPLWHAILEMSEE